MGEVVKARRSTSTPRGKTKARIARSAPSRQRSAGGAGRKPGHWISQERLNALQESLRESQETLAAIRSGEVDAVVVSGANGNQVYSLAGAEQPYRIYVEQMREGAVTVADSGVILYCNQHFADMLQLPLERVIGSRLTEYVNESVWPRLAGILVPEAASATLETLLRRGRSADLLVNLSASRLPIEDQAMLCLVVTDLSIRRENEELRLAKEVAEKASAAKDSFLAALSHELRTPLTPALMVAMALEQDPKFPPHQKEQIALVRRNVELEARLIDDLLDLTRIIHGKLELHVGPNNFHTLLGRAVEICQADIQAKKQTLKLRFAAKKSETVGDGARLQQVFWNLIRNAVKFTPENGVIEITTGNRGGERVWIRVSDTGIGFDRATGGKIFEPFEQGSREITRQFGGLGLGLAISRSIVEAHGGSIRAESSGVGRGATFTVELPVREAEVVARLSVATPPAAAENAARLRILLVEDHRDTRNSMRRLLEIAEHQVVAAENAREALEHAAQGSFDLVISDLGLPDQSGHELMRQLRERHGLPGIALSGFGMEEDLARSRAAGFSHHLIKPVAFRQLKELIAQFAAANARRSESTSPS